MSEIVLGFNVYSKVRQHSHTGYLTRCCQRVKFHVILVGWEHKEGINPKLIG